MTRVFTRVGTTGHDFHGLDRPYPGATDQKVHSRATRYQDPMASIPGDATLDIYRMA